MQKRAKALMRNSTLRWLLLGAVQICTFALSGIAAFLLRFDFRMPADYRIYLAAATQGGGS